MLQARVYDFDITAENSRWMMRMGDETIQAAYKGSVWVEKESGRILRLEMQTHDLPEGFPMNRLDTDVEYSLAGIGQSSVLVPAHVETVGCDRTTNVCSRSVVDFQNYRRKPAN